MAKAKARAYVGTSGWSYDHWRNDVFYPAGLASTKWLAFLADRFDTVELNASFYRWPRDTTVKKWAETVPEGFRFGVKLWRGFTHYSRLEDPKDSLPRFMALFDAMPPKKRGPLLVQLPPQMDVDAHRLDRFLAKLEPYGWQTCVEFRNDSWLEGGIVDILDRHGAALCVHDMKWAAPVEEPNAAPFVYVRRHGPGHKYSGTYSDERIAADAAAIRGWLAGGRDVYVYYNNDRRGNAVRDAARLKQALADATVRRRRRPARLPSTEQPPKAPAKRTPRAVRGALTRGGKVRAALAGPPASMAEETVP